ncbi:leucine-rich repeat protein [bacterium]|nr:leucine-rich repeat protein [bacterium]
MIKYKKFLLLVLCIFILGTFVSACGGGGKSTPPSYPFIPTPTPEQYQLELSQTEFTVNVGETDNITVTLNGKDITQTATYTVDEEAIASVEGGLITGLSVGVATVTVHAENAIEDKTFTVNVIDPSLPTLEAEPSEINLGIDEGATVKVTLNGEDVTEKVNYKSDNESIATVEKGIVKSKYIEGTANITVSLEGANSATFKVNVTDDSEEVTLNDDVLDQLHELGIIAKGSDDKTELTEANIPAVFKYNDQKYKITSIGEYAFENCSSLTSITMPESITSIEDNAFAECSSLTSVIIPEGVTSIEYGTFRACSSLTSITMPESITSIEDAAFSHCSLLTSITIPESVTSIGDSAFYDCSSLQSVTIPDSVISIEDNAFAECSSLQSITIPDSVTSIGMYAFEDCSSLTSIIIPEGVTSIEYGTFIACSSLTNVTIPKTVNIISNSAFRGCSLLENVTIEDGYNVLCIFPLAFYDCDNLTKLNTTNGKEITIPTTEVSKTDENVTFIGAKLYSPDIQGEIVIPNGITKIPHGAFYNCSKLTGVTIPDSVTSIIDYAFYDCKNLTTVTIPEGVTSIGYCAFYGCKNSALTIAIPDSVTSIGEYAFYNVAEITYNSQMTATGTPWGAKKVNGVAQ